MIELMLAEFHLAVSGSGSCYYACCHTVTVALNGTKSSLMFSLTGQITMEDKRVLYKVVTLPANINRPHTASLI